MTPEERSQRYESLLVRLGNVIGLENLSPDNEHRCRLVFDDVLEVTMDAVPEDGIVWLHSAVGPAPVRNAPEVYRRLLGAACFGQGTLGASVALDESSNSIILQRNLHIDSLEYDAFEESLTDFVNALEIWQMRLADPSGAAAIVAGRVETATPHAVQA